VDIADDINRAVKQRIDHMHNSILCPDRDDRAIRAVNHASPETRPVFCTDTGEGCC
jgi:hypothetical protein